MLAQNFKTVAQLKITDAEFDALAKVLGMLERGELKHQRGFGSSYNKDHFGFNMGDWCTRNECGTTACIGGWVALFTGRDPKNYVHSAVGAMRELYFPKADDGHLLGTMNQITTDQAAIALRNYLTHGEPRWDEALA